MSRMLPLFLFLLLCIPIMAIAQTAHAVPASSFHLQNGDWYDNFGIDRNYYAGPDGFMPHLASETLGNNNATAYAIGLRFQDNYQSKTERAVAILRYVQRWTEYGYDEDNVVMNGETQAEWAWNADEMAGNFSEVTGAEAIGDCEDMAFLCGTIYVGAGIDAAVVDAPEHAALLIWLPEFANADYYWDLPNDDRDAGWIWVEATGESNPLGWTPPDFENGGWTAYPIGSLQFVPETQPGSSEPTPIGSIDLDLLVTVAVIILSIILALAKSNRGR